jgi:signal transduction histidine kinase
LNQINQETITLLRDQAVRDKVLVRTELAADLPGIIGDRVQLQQVAMNLIVNGIEAMRDVDGTREMLIKSQRTENEQILLSISDTGIGFPPQLAEQIFDPFFTTKPQGTGMGLRICRSIIESHGGRLCGVGTPGQGATFYLSLPIARSLPQSLITSRASVVAIKPMGGVAHQGPREPGRAGHLRTTRLVG